MKVQWASWKDPAETICFLWLSIQVCKGGGNELGTTDLEPSLTSARAKSKTLSNSTNSLHLRFLLKRKICGCSTKVCISHIHCSWLRETNHLMHWQGKFQKRAFQNKAPHDIIICSIIIPYPWRNERNFDFSQGTCCLTIYNNINIRNINLKTLIEETEENVFSCIKTSLNTGNHCFII